MSKNALAVLAGLALLAAGCSPGSTPSDVSDYDVVVTLYAEDADFPSAHTFALVDTVMHIVGESGQDDISRQYDDLILSQVQADMLAQGWTEITAPDSIHKPDVALQVGVATADYVHIEYWPSYWGYYPGWSYPSYGYGWGGGSYTAYNYTTGTVIMAMVDLRNPNLDTETLPVMWVGAVSGVAAGTSSNETRIVAGIDQAFAQSPYLRK